MPNSKAEKIITMSAIITFILVLAIFTSSFSLWCQIIYEKNISLTPCFTELCYKNAINYFKTPLEILKSLTFIVPVLAFILGLKTYNLSQKGTLMSNHLACKKDFQEDVSSLLKLNNNIAPEIVNLSKMYNFLYQSPQCGDFSLSKEAKLAIRKINQVQIKSEKDFDKNNKALDDVYPEKMSKIYSLFGINIDSDVQLKEYTTIEINVMEFINNVITFYFNNESTKLNTSTRRYR